jgi:hypothetical protein
MSVCLEMEDMKGKQPKEVKVVVLERIKRFVVLVEEQNYKEASSKGAGIFPYLMIQFPDPYRNSLWFLRLEKMFESNGRICGCYHQGLMGKGPVDMVRVKKIFHDFIEPYVLDGTMIEDIETCIGRKI